MKKLLLHLGYPKSASTTLQNGLFYELHKNNVTNFIGKAHESGFYGPAGNKKKYKAWLRTISGDRTLPARLMPSNDPIRFSDDKLNVMSEELFILRDREHNRSVMPDKIRDYFGEKVDEAEFLFVVRNQQTLVMSYFVQIFRKFQQATFDDYLEEVVAPQKNAGTGVFNFHNVIGRYAEVLGKKNIHIVFFEDFVNDRNTFGEEISGILGVEPELVGKLLTSVHMNRTPKRKNGYVVRKPERRGTLNQLATGARRLAGIAPEPKDPIVIPDMTDKQKSRIFAMFKDDNQKFAEEFGLDCDRMRKYGYF